MFVQDFRFTLENALELTLVILRRKYCLWFKVYTLTIKIFSGLSYMNYDAYYTIVAV